MPWDTDLGSVSPFPLLKFCTSNFRRLENNTFDQFKGGAQVFSFDCRITPTSGENSNLKLLS